MKLSKTILILGLLTTTSSQAFASADLGGCVSKVANTCIASLCEYAQMLTASSCKMISDNQMTFTSSDKSSIFNVDIANCQASRYNFAPNHVTDSTIFNHKLFAVLDIHKVYVVNEANDVYEMLTSDKQSYKEVDSVSNQYGGLYMTRTKHAAIWLPANKVEERTSHTRTMDLVAVSKTGTNCPRQPYQYGQGNYGYSSHGYSQQNYGNDAYSGF